MSLPRYCPNCGALVSDATFCSKCGTFLGPRQSPKPKSDQPRILYSPTRSTLSNNLSQRLERAWRRVELLSYMAIGLSVIILLETLYWIGVFG